MTKNLNGITIIDSVNSISADETAQLLNTGICYLKISADPNFELFSESIRSTAVGFFEKTESEKAAVKGYTDRRVRAKPEFVEKLSFPIADPSTPFAPYSRELQHLNAQIQQDVIIPLLAQIFSYVGKPELHQQLVDTNSTYLSITAYPKPDKKDDGPTLGLVKHKDWGSVSLLFVRESGLKIQVTEENEKVWKDVEPLEGYVVIILGNVLQIMLGKDKCKAATHKVELTDRRLTVGLFFSPPPSLPIVNAFSGEQLFSNFSPEYMDTRLRKFE